MLQKLKDNINHYIKAYINDIDSELLIYNSVISIGIIALTCILVTEYIMHYETTGLLMMAALWMYLIVLSILANLYPKMIRIFSVLVIAPINFVMFPFMFLVAEGGGVKSGMPVWLVFGLILVCIIPSGIYFKIMMLLTVAMDSFLFVYGYFHQDIFKDIDNELYYYQDNLVAIFAVACSIGMILKYQKYVQKKQTERIEGAIVEAEQEKQNAQKANAAKTSFLTNMSHDIRTPMNAIVGMTDIARFNIDDKEKVQDCLNKITASSTQLLNLLNNILDMSEIEMQELKLKEYQFSLTELIDNIQVVLTQMARSRKVELTIKCDIEHTNLLGDSVRLRQVLMNIISNGIKYTEAFGRVDVSIKEIESADAECAEYGFEITDTGVGMTQEFIENHIFMPFERAEDRFVQRVEGSGIGMNITKKIIDAMDAELRIESEVGVGSKFYVQMRFKKDKEIQKNFVREKDGLFVLDATGKNLLVVEDNEVNMEIIKAILERTHAHVTCAWDAEEAIDIISKSKEGHFDLIFMDIQMPGMDGYTATRTIRCMDRHDSMTIPIIAMTANAFAQDVEKAFNAGMNAHIAKPVDVEELFQKMYHFLYT
ncbi:MAG: response regulator [Lachnospiraceae bacterium]|nr:response regulator [Lachnospiraceae bacterium]MBO5144638.1 response regulator [Lachnospiraceae bacterium]